MKVGIGPLLLYLYVLRGGAHYSRDHSLTSLSGGKMIERLSENADVKLQQRAMCVSMNIIIYAPHFLQCTFHERAEKPMAQMR